MHGIAVTTLTTSSLHRSLSRGSGSLASCITRSSYSSVSIPFNAQMIGSLDTSTSTISEMESAKPPLIRLPTKKADFGKLLDYRSNVVAVGGHRGHGANYWCSEDVLNRYPVRENTLASFHRSVEAGASFIEFDVQVTSDRVPVIWHDNFVVTGTSAAPVSQTISQLTHEEFHSLVDPLHDCDDDGRPISPRTAGAEGAGARARRAGRLLRKLVADDPATGGDPSLRAWECEHEDALPDLADVFAHVAPHIAFDIEIKVATPATLRRTPDEEIDRLLRPILEAADAAEAHAKEGGFPPRDILYSSFDPDVCAELRRRRPGAHVMFLSGGGQYEHVDERRTSIPGALEWAREATLNGVIIHTSRLRAGREYIPLARLTGLEVMSYGIENSDTRWVREQFALGVHGVIVDDVTGVVRGLEPVDDTPSVASSVAASVAASSVDGGSPPPTDDSFLSAQQTFAAINASWSASVKDTCHARAL